MTKLELKKIINEEINNILNEFNADEFAINSMEEIISELYQVLKKKHSMITRLSDDDYAELSIALEETTDEFGEYLERYFVGSLTSEENFIYSVIRWFERKGGSYELRPTVQNAINIISELR